MQMTLTHNDYTVAWICALPLEMAAAKAMLDDVHTSLSQPKSDHNIYTLGTISGHNVVVACLPLGIYGTISASTVVSHMVSTFPNIRFGLMVGIGGGVPSKRVDIRLGDVVVSKPTATSGGVIQYDYGKTFRDGQFQRMGSLNKPPLILLKAVAQMESDYMTGKRLVSKTMCDALQKNQEIRERFTKPKADWLFQPTYNHKENRPNCSACDRSQLVNRPQRTSDEPCIHYGLIASGDQVMKDAKTRDFIAQDLGILCFEMEAAGLMDELPSLVIRGVCDYCDSHKHDQWQGYAALTAAAYATALLFAVPMTDHKTPPEQKTNLTVEDKECLQGLFITDPTDDKNALKRRKGARAPGTCSWIMETAELKTWLGCFAEAKQEELNILWLYGNPGTGKSTVAITLAEELPTLPCFTGENRLFAYFFCDSGSETQRTAISILRGILYTFISQRPILVKYLLPKYATRKGKLFSSFDALWATLLDMCQSSDISGLYCIIDALDECERESQETILRQIHQTFKNEPSMYPGLSKLHILITSRPYPEIHEFLSCYRSRNMASYPSVAEDVRIVIDERVKDLTQRKRYPETVAAEVSRILEDKADGTFLWVGIVCDELAQGQSRNAVKSLQKLPRGLQSLYQTLLRASTANVDEDDKVIIEKMLSLVAFSRRPLTLAEVSEACQLYPHEDLDSRLQFTREFIDLCRLMIVLEGNRVRLLHKSVKDFLVTELREINDLKANATLAYRCIQCILHNCRSGIDEQVLHPEQGFIGYAVLHWPEHAGLSRTEFRVREEHENFFQLQSAIWGKWLHAYNYIKRNSWNKLDIGFSPFHAAAQWGIPQVISSLLPGNLEVKDCRGQSPLLIAAQNFQLETVHHLIKHGAQVNALNNMRQNALHMICRNPGENALELTEILLTHGSSTSICDVDNMTPFLYAIGNQREDLALMFLRERFDINVRIHRQCWTNHMQNGIVFYDKNENNEKLAEAAPNLGLTALHFSTLNAATEITAFLLRRGADPNACSNSGDTPLHLAIRGQLLEHKYKDPWMTGEYAVESYYITDRESEEASEIHRNIDPVRVRIVDILLADKTINVNIANSQGDCPVHVIPFHETYASTILFKLLRSGAERSRLNEEGQTCLHLASKAGNLEAVCRLVDDGYDSALLDANGVSPLRYAVSYGRLDVVRFLLEHHEKQPSKPSHMPDPFSKNLLHYHVGSRLCSMEMVCLLLERGCKVDETDAGGNSALSLCLSSSHFVIKSDIFFLLVENGANPLWVNGHKQNLAHLLMRHWGADITILEFLLQCGLDPTVRDAEGKEIMHHGAIYGSFSKHLVWFLRTKGILRLHVKDSSGKTPLEYAEEQACRKGSKNCSVHAQMLESFVRARRQESFDNLKNAASPDTV